MSPVRKDGKKRSGQFTHTVRTKDGGTKTLTYGRKQAMSMFCTECFGWDSDPKDCTAKLCPMWPWRVKTEATLRSGK